MTSKRVIKSEIIGWNPSDWMLTFEDGSTHKAIIPISYSISDIGVDPGHFRVSTLFGVSYIFDSLPNLPHVLNRIVCVEFG